MEETKQQLLDLIDEFKIDEESKERMIEWIKNISLDTLMNDKMLFIQGSGSDSKGQMENLRNVFSTAT